MYSELYVSEAGLGGGAAVGLCVVQCWYVLLHSLSIDSSHLFPPCLACPFNYGISSTKPYDFPFPHAFTTSSPSGLPEPNAGRSKSFRWAFYTTVSVQLHLFRIDLTQQLVSRPHPLTPYQVSRGSPSSSPHTTTVNYTQKNSHYL